MVPIMQPTVLALVKFLLLLDVVLWGYTLHVTMRGGQKIGFIATFFTLHALVLVSVMGLP